MLHRWSFIAVALPVMLAPLTALADITDATLTVQIGQNFSLDSGTIVSSGGDFKWDGVLLTPQGSTKFFYVGPGDSTYQGLNKQTIQAFQQLATGVPLAVSQLVNQSVIGVFTSGGNVAKLEVTSTAAPSGVALPIKFTTYGTTGSGGGSGAPTISSILNNYSLTPLGFVNSGVAASTIIVVKGSNLGDAPPASGLGLNTTAGAGLPTTSAGASATISAGGKTYPFYLYYASPTQMAGVIPGAVPAGSATMTVTYKSLTSAPFSFTVVSSALGLGTYNGITIATDALTGVLVDYTHSAVPGRTYVFWGSGGGADTADSDFQYTTTPHAINQGSTQFYFGTKQGTVLYSGSSGFPGLMQINVTLPSNSDTGCGVTVVGIVNGVPSNFGPIPIDATGVCHDSIYGLSGTDLSAANSGTIKTGSVFVGQFVSPPPTGTSSIAEASFASTSGAYSGSGSISLGSCSVQETVTGSSNVTTTPLDAGTINLNGPGVSTALQAFAKGTYIGQLSANAVTAGSTFTFTGSGGADVGAFSASITLPNPLLTWTNQGSLSTVTRANGIPVTWSGGSPGSYVIITGSSSTLAGVSGSFTCYAPQSAGSFTVPAFVAATLPAGSGSLLIENTTLPQKFTAPKLDQGFAFGLNAIQINSTFN